MTSNPPLMSASTSSSFSQPVTLPDFASSAAMVDNTCARDVTSRFGVKLREFRLGRNLTQLRMSKEFGIDRSFISDVERGRKSISLPMLEVMALGLQVSLSELLRDL